MRRIFRTSGQPAATLGQTQTWKDIRLFDMWQGISQKGKDHSQCFSAKKIFTSTCKSRAILWPSKSCKSYI